MEPCAFHAEHAAIEQCEVCRRPLCDVCLWYGSDGRRLCLAHAREHESGGGTIFSPESYEHALRPRDFDPQQRQPVSAAPYRGNQHDLSAALAALIGLVSLASCAGGAYCLPVAAGLIGLVSFGKANLALNPERTRRLSIIGMLIGLLGLVPLLLFAGYFLVIFVLIGASAFGAGP